MRFANERSLLASSQEVDSNFNRDQLKLAKFVTSIKQQQQQRKMEAKSGLIDCVRGASLMSKLPACALHCNRNYATKRARLLVALVCALALISENALIRVAGSAEPQTATAAAAAASNQSQKSSVNSTSATSGARVSLTASEPQPAQLSPKQEPLEQRATDVKLARGSLEAFEDLIAIGRVSLSAAPAPPFDLQDGASSVEWRRARQDGSLVDSPPAQQQQQQQQKLDYIIEFLRANKLTRFCNLLTSSQRPLRSAVEQLNQMKQFTLFVPTNEALALMPASQLEALQVDAEEAKRFLMAHVTSELVVPKLPAPVERAAGGSLAQLASKYSPSGTQNRWSSGRPLERLVQEESAGELEEGERAIYSLAGAHLRIITTPTVGPESGLNSTKLELIVNGAHVLSGHSHALQEPNNTQVTYAIVHLIDRSLYPIATHSLYENIRTLAPQFAKLIDLSQDQQLVSKLKLLPRSRPLTAFVPQDDSLRALQSKLLDQLETNRTHLQHFLRSHFVEGIFFAGQLTGTSGQSVESLANSSSMRLAPHIPRQLSSLSGAELEFEWKLFQARQVILVNSVPLLEHDQMALNGVLHTITRPLLDRHLLDVACNCDSKLLASSAANSSSALDELLLINKFRADNQQRAQVANNSKQQLEQEPTDPAAEVGATAATSSRQRANLSWFRESAPAEVLQPAASKRRPQAAAAASNELEREESQPIGQSASVAPQAHSNKIVRAQRSDSLIARNNRDFYRPSTAPVNVLLLSEPDGASLARSQLDNSSLGQPEIIMSGGSQTDSWTNGQARPTSVIATSGQLQAAAPQEALAAAAPFEVDRYKVVLNATSRQRLREQQGLIMASSLSGNQAEGSAANRFAYDQPLSTQRTPTALGGDQLRYLPSTLDSSPSTQTNQTAAPSRASGQDQISSSSSTQRQQRLLLKFQAEDARDKPNYGANSNFSLSEDENLARLGAQHEPSSARNQQRFGKTVAPPLGNTFSGCAFYDADCKRFMGRLVRLPPNPSGQLKSSQNRTATQQQQQQQQQANLFPQLSVAHQVGPAFVAPPAVRVQPAASTLPTVFDSTFGETTETPLSYSASAPNSARFGPAMRPSQQQLANGSLAQKSLDFSGPPPAPATRQFVATSFTNLTPMGTLPARISSLNQPLPPWSEEEHKLATSQLVFGAASGGQAQSGKQSWRANELLADITRIQLSSAQKVSPTNSVVASNSDQVLMVPVRMLQDSNISLPSSRLRQTQSAGSFNHTNSGPPPVYFAPSQSGGQLTGAPAHMTFSSNSQYFTPTVQPTYVTVGPQSTPPLLHQPLGRLTNFTALEMPSSLEPSEPLGASQQQQQLSPTAKQPPAAQLKTPIMQHRLRTQSALAANFSSSNQQQQQQQQQLDAQLRDSIKQARKLVRLQTAPNKQDEGFDYAAPAKTDISVTSARLSASPLASKSPTASNFSLAVQASNQSPDVSRLAATSAFAPPRSQLAAPLIGTGSAQELADNVGAQSPSADFFQNRTIAEIMDDSGLRIDGQQVTFGRLRECLEKADLFNLVQQPGSAITIFMPTDAAFQRLVQQQALMQQRVGRSTGVSARLSDPARKHLIPLVAKMPNSRREGDTSARLQEASSNTIELSAAASAQALANRLTLDCSTQQARQLLLDHLSGQLVTPRQLQSDVALSSLSGRRLLLSSVPSKKIVVVDGQPVIAATRAKNGMVYVVNKFLNISQQMPNVIDLLEAQPNLKTFQSYLAFASLSDRLKRETGPLTILAPTNEAFEQLSSAARQLINTDPSAMMDILRGHIIEGAQFGKLISMRNRLKTMNSDHFIDAKVIKPNIYQLDNQMTSMKLIGTAGNGVVNSIDRLIVPSWLRVATGTSRQAPGNTIGSAESTFTARIPEVNENVGRWETSRQAAGSSNLNLPLLSNQPLSFEQPDARLAPPNSFSLAGSTTPSSSDFATRNNSLLDSFGDSILGFDNPSNGRPASNLGESPFSRVAATNSTTTQTPPGGRLTFNDPNELLKSPPSSLANSSSLASSTGNKNMQLIEKLAHLMRAKKFVNYLLRSPLRSTLKPDMNYVILVPTDQAMERLPKQIIDMLERDPERLGDLVNFHVLDTTFEYINTIPDGQTLNTVNEKDILFNWHRNNTILTASGAVVLGGIQEENIALLIVDRVLYPTPGDLLSIVAKSPILSNFTSLIRNARLESQLSLVGPFTLFAPSDFAFNQLDRRDFEFLQRDRETARRFLLRHLSQPAVFTSSIALSNATDSTMPKNRPANQAGASAIPLMTISNSLGEELTLRQRNDYFSVNEVNFSYADVAATNGVMHVIDGLL